MSGELDTEEVIVASVLHNFDNEFGKVETKETPKKKSSWEDTNPEYLAHKVRSESDWDSRDIFWLFLELYQECYGLEPSVDFIRDRAIAKRFTKQWGVERAAQLLRYFFFEDKGLFQGQRQSIMLLSNSADWIVQLIYHKMSQRTEVSTPIYKTVRYLTSDEFLRNFA